MPISNKKRIFDFKLEVLKDDKKNYSMSLRIEGELVPASRPRITKFGSYIAEPYKSFKNQFAKLIRDNLLESASIFINQPLSIDISYFKSIPKSYSKEKKKKAFIDGCTNRPDLDNYYKAILDSMDKVFYSDDSFVVELSGRKLYTESEKSYLLININKFKSNIPSRFNILN